MIGLYLDANLGVDFTYLDAKLGMKLGANFS
jgi:hypothetical protein